MSRPVFSAPYPVNLDLAGQRVLVVGGGPIGHRKALGLLRADAVVTLVAPDAVDEVRANPDIRWHQRAYRRGEAASYRLVITATDDPAVNAQVARDGRAANIFVNSADDPENCDFTLPSIVRRGDLQIAVSTNGRSPALARWLRRRIDAKIGAEFTDLLEVLSALRDELRATRGTSEVTGWDEAIDDELIELVADGDRGGARQRLRSALELPVEREVPV